VPNHGRPEAIGEEVAREGEGCIGEAGGGSGLGTGRGPRYRVVPKAAAELGREDAARLLDALRTKRWLGSEQSRKRKQVLVPVLKKRPRPLAGSLDVTRAGSRTPN
jgi:hypothetical protein